MKVIRSTLSIGRAKMTKVKNKKGIIDGDRSKTLYGYKAQGSQCQKKVIKKLGFETNIGKLKTALHQIKNRKSPGAN